MKDYALNKTTYIEVLEDDWKLDLDQPYKNDKTHYVEFLSCEEISTVCI